MTALLTNVGGQSAALTADGEREGKHGFLMLLYDKLTPNQTRYSRLRLLCIYADYTYVYTL